MIMKSTKGILLRLLLIATMLVPSLLTLAVGTIPVMAAGIKEALPDGKEITAFWDLKYPVLTTTDVQYYITNFPPGLRYSETWYGTFEKCFEPKEILLFDDENGICVFSLKPGQVLGKPQGGTTVRKASVTEARDLIKSYTLEDSVKSIDPEIKEILPSDAYFMGVWSGEKLKEKFDPAGAKTNALTEKQIRAKALYNEAIENSEPFDFAKYDPDRYAVMGQMFIVNGAVITVAEAGKIVADTTLNLSTTGGAGNFTLYMASGTTGTLTSGTATITGSVVTLSAGLNTITSNGAGNCALDITIGTAANWSSVNSWSATSGGACTASVPTSADNAYHNANSYTGANQTFTVDASANCLSMDFTGALYTPTLAKGSSTIYVSGNVTTIAAMKTTGGGYLTSLGASNKTITTNGLVWSFGIAWEGSSTGKFTLLGDFTTTGNIWLNRSTLDTNGKTVTCASFSDSSSTTTKTVTLGNSTLNCTAWSFTGTGALTVTANTATINVSGNSAFGNANYNGASLCLFGTIYTIGGNNTLNNINLSPTVIQTLTIAAGARITATTATLSGDATHQHTILSGTAGTLASIWATNKADDYVTYTNMLRNYNGVIVADCAGTGGGTFAGANGAYTSLTVQGAGNYPLTVTGNNTFNNDFKVDASLANKTVVQAATAVQTVGQMSRGTVIGTNYVTLNGGTWNKTDTNPNALGYMNIINSTATPTDTWYAGATPPSIDGGGNTGWIFTQVTLQSATTLLPTGVTMDKDGVTSVTLSGSIGQIDGSPTFSEWFDFGLTDAYGSSTTALTSYASGNYSSTVRIPNVPISNVGTYQTTPTYEGSGQAVHPSVVCFNTPWHGYSYWMAMTPYPGGNDAYENPSILASNDGATWVVPFGLTNPIEAFPGGGMHNCDPALFYDSATDNLWMYYMTAGAGTTTLYRKTSVDGVTWNVKQAILSMPDCQMLSPSIDKVGVTYYLWSSNNGNTVELRISSDGVTWGAPSTVNISQSGYKPWHLEVQYVSSLNLYVMLLTAYEISSNNAHTALFYADSNDGVNWTTYSNPLLSPTGEGWDSRQIYQSSFFYDPTTGIFNIWYSAVSSLTAYWHIGFTTCNYVYEMPTNLTPGQTYHYRSSANNTVSWVNGTDQTFTFTMPAATSSAVTNVSTQETAVLTGNVTGMGVASSVYTYFQWGYSASSYGYETTHVAQTGTGAFSTTIITDTALSSDKSVYFRAVIEVGSTQVLGGQETALLDRSVAKYSGVDQLISITPMLIFVLFIVAGVAMFVVGLREHPANQMLFVTGFLIIMVGLVIFMVLLDSVESILTWH